MLRSKRQLLILPRALRPLSSGHDSQSQPKPKQCPQMSGSGEQHFLGWMWLGRSSWFCLNHRDLASRRVPHLPRRSQKGKPEPVRPQLVIEISYQTRNRKEHPIKLLRSVYKKPYSKHNVLIFSPEVGKRQGGPLCCQLTKWNKAGKEDLKPLFTTAYMWTQRLRKNLQTITINELTCLCTKLRLKLCFSTSQKQEGNGSWRHNLHKYKGTSNT
jgi:hypothetical protein